MKGRKGESQLVFKDGYIVSASHLNNSVRIGQVYVEKKMISPEHLEQGMQKQHLDGGNRRPLAITLIEMGVLSEDDAYRGLQQLIEMTVVEILTWKRGKFTLDHLTDIIDSSFKYYPERMNHEINVNTQGILMDALRIFDEKVRDGLIEDEPEEPPAAAAEEVISADDLGLSEIDYLADNLPQAFSGAAPPDPLSFQKEKVQELAPYLSPAAVTKIAECLAKYTVNLGDAMHDKQASALLVLASDDTLLGYAMEMVAKSGGVCLTAAGTGADVEAITEHALSSGFPVRVVFDGPVVSGAANSEAMLQVRNRLCSCYPELVCLQLVSTEPPEFALDSYRSGVRALMPRPSLEARPGSFAEDFIALVEFLPLYLLAVTGNSDRAALP